MRYIGIDYGTKKVGVATGDDGHGLAFPRCVLPNDAKLIEEIKHICEEEAIGGVVMGESVDFKGNPNIVMKEIQDFAKLLEKELDIPVYFEPEFMTSVQARKIQGRNNLIDASAAALILQSYFERKR